MSRTGGGQVHVFGLRVFAWVGRMGRKMYQTPARERVTVQPSRHDRGMRKRGRPHVAPRKVRDNLIGSPATRRNRARGGPSGGAGHPLLWVA